MSRVLLLCPEPLGHRQPAGVGIRFLEFSRALRAAGHTVTLLTPDAATIEGCTGGSLTPTSIRDATVHADVAVVQGHVVNELLAHGARIPTVVDLYDPYIVENLHYWRTRGDEVFLHDHATMLRSFQAGDFFLCASHSQKLFYLGMMTVAGRLHPSRLEADPSLDSLLALAPFGVPQRISPPVRSASNAVLFGGIYDWYSPIVAVDAVAIASHEIPDITLTFTRHPNPDVTPQGAARETMDYVRARKLENFVRFEPWVQYERRLDFYSAFALALLTFPQSIETDLSMRTRIYDYLWAGLPVITSSAAGTDEIIERYGVGSVVPSDDAQVYAAKIVDTLKNRAQLETMRAASDAFVADHQWGATLEPLLTFCAKPRFDATRDAWSSTPATPTLTAARRRWVERIRRRFRRNV